MNSYYKQFTSYALGLLIFSSAFPVAAKADPLIKLIKTANSSPFMALGALPPAFVTGNSYTNTYTITNTGNVPLSKVTLSDSSLPKAALDGECSAVATTGITLDVGQSVTCTSTSGITQVQPGTRTSSATVTALANGKRVSTTASASYVGMSNINCPSTCTGSIDSFFSDNAVFLPNTSISFLSYTTCQYTPGQSKDDYFAQINIYPPKYPAIYYSFMWLFIYESNAVCNYCRTTGVNTYGCYPDPQFIANDTLDACQYYLQSKWNSIENIGSSCLLKNPNP